MEPLVEEVAVELPAAETRFMTLVRGGESPRHDIDPGRNKVGIRVHQQSSTLPTILQFRQRMLLFESSDALEGRKASTNRRSAFGSGRFQPHMTLLNAGSGIERDLTQVGVPFRAELGILLFDRFVVEVTTRSSWDREDD